MKDKPITIAMNTFFNIAEHESPILLYTFLSEYEDGDEYINEALLKDNFKSSAWSPFQEMGVNFMWDSVQDLINNILHEYKPDWRPIETAPKDGTELLLVVAGFIPSTGHFDTEYQKWVLVDEKEFSDLLCWEDYINGVEYLPTHWMPLPTTPDTTCQS